MQTSNMAFITLLNYCEWFVAALGLIVVAQHASCGTLNNSQTLIQNLLHGYNIEVRPVLNQDHSVNVSVGLYITSIQEIDEVKEMFAFTAGLYLAWEDPRMLWAPEMYNGTQEIVLPYTQVWVPEVLLINPTENGDSVGHQWQKVRYRSNGSAQWIPGNHFKSNCPMNVRNFPFDSQACSVSFSAYGYTTGEVNLEPLSDKIYLHMFGGNAAWDIVDTNVEKGIFVGSSELVFMVDLKRKSAYYVINILMPITALWFLNAVSFLLLPASGERISFCITVFLSISVFLSIISDSLPHTSEPVPIISYSLMYSAVLSSATTMVAILNMRLYHRDEQLNVPQCLQKFYLCIVRQKNTTGGADPEENATFISQDNISVLTDRPDSIQHENTTEAIENRSCKSIFPRETDQVKWREISILIDYISFVCFAMTGLSLFTWFWIATMV